VTILADATLRERLMSGNLGVSPFEMRHLQPASLDLTLGDRLLVTEYGVILDPETDQTDQWTDVQTRGADGRWCVYGNRLYLGATAERVRIPDDCVGLLSGVSTLARQGLQIHATAGFVDPGFHGRLTLEIVLFGQTILLRPGMRICQLALYRMDRPAEHSYSGRYAGDDDVSPAKVVRHA
jgi:dCTP deaminase